MSQAPYELPKTTDDLTPEITHHQILPKGEDRISGKECPPMFFGLSKESRENVMRRSVASLDKFLLATKTSDGSTLSRLNVYVTKNKKGQKVVKIAGCTVGDSRPILADAKKTVYLTKSHNLSEEKMRKKFTKGQINSDTRRHYDHINMGRSMNDLFHKQDPEFTAEPEIVDREIVINDHHKLILASDGIEYKFNGKKRCVLSDLNFYYFKAKNISSMAQKRGSKDDISVIVIDIPPAQAEGKEIKESCVTYGVDDGHGGATTATLCSTYYYPIQHFWTLVFQAYEKLGASFPPRFQDAIQKDLVDVLYELHSCGKIKKILPSDLLFHPKLPFTEIMRNKLNQLYTETFGPFNKLQIKNFIKSGNGTLITDAKEYKGINWDDMYDVAIASNQQSMATYLRTKEFITFESWATRLAEKQDAGCYERAIKHEPNIRLQKVGKPPQFPIDLAREKGNWELMRLLFETPANAYAYIVIQPKEVLMALNGEPIVPNNGLAPFTQRFIHYLLECKYAPESTATHLVNNQMTDVFQYLLDKIKNSQGSIQLKLEQYNELYKLATQFFNLDATVDVRKTVRNYARDTLLDKDSKANNHELFIARNYAVFNEHRDGFGMFRKTNSVKKIEEKLDKLDSRLLDGLSSNLTRSVLVLGILGCGLEVYLHGFESDLVDQLTNNPNLNLGIEISVSVITFFALLYVAIKEYSAYKARKEMISDTNLAEDKESTVDTDPLPP